jgi:NhaP-type Na+/H+ and K+/H+ antiporter
LPAAQYRVGTVCREVWSAAVSRALDGFLAPACAVIIYAVGQAIGTYGLLAVFIAGIP